MSVKFDKAYIGGEWVDAKDSKTFEVLNPVNRQVVAKLPILGYQDTKDAIAHAVKAQQIWQNVIPKERGRLIRKLFELIIQNKDELARLMVLENGKTINEACAEIEYAASFVEWFSEEAKRIYGDVVPAVKAGQRFYTIKQPVGVVGAITPWNFPLAMITRKITPAIAAVCPVVIKPSEETPLSALAFAKLFAQLDFPKGLVNIVFGNANEIGNALCESLDVKMLTFTGSTNVGKLLAAKASNTVKKLALELGGNAPFIVLADADLKAAAKGLAASKLRNGGQSCTCANRIYVHKSVMQEFSKHLITEFSGIRVGDGMKEDTKLGTMINDAAVKKINSLVADALANGSECLFEADLSDEMYSKGAFAAPMIIKNNTVDLNIEVNEIFGPIASLYAFDSVEEVVTRANKTNYGLAAYIYTQDRWLALNMAEKLEYGMVAVNDYLLANEMTSFGGIKESGLGREGGKHGILEFLEDKFIAIN